MMTSLEGINIKKCISVVYIDPEKAKSDEPYNKLYNMAVKLHNNPVEKGEGWDEILVIGTDPIRDLSLDQGLGPAPYRPSHPHLILIPYLTYRLIFIPDMGEKDMGG